MESLETDEAPSRLLAPRDVRRPLFVPVVTNAPLLQCWTENVSARGLGLVGQLAPNAELPKGQLSLRFALPGGGVVDAVGEVVWGRRTDRRQGVALGVTFVDVDEDAARAVVRFVAEYRFRVALVAATLQCTTRVEEAIGDFAQIEHVDSEDEAADGTAAIVLWRSLPVGPDPQGTDGGARCIALVDVADHTAVAAFRTGRVASILAEDVDVDALRAAVFQACRAWSLRSELRSTAIRLARELERASTSKPSSSPSSHIIAESPQMRALFAEVNVVAPRKVVVLLEGETGTGKEVLAKEIHARSARAQRPLVVQDCGTLTETLLDSELFGHVRGAFTGAHADHPGLFVVADGGTVFLDEIENTTPALQAKLLRVIESGEIRPVGGTRTRVVDVRMIAATNTNLRRAVDAGRFRADLYYRLSAFPIAIPPLRDRGSDVLLLAERLARDAARTHFVLFEGFDDDAVHAIAGHHWPGNVRQLRNAMERAVLLAQGRVGLSHLPLDVVGDAARAPTLADRLGAYERRLIETALLEADGVVARAAIALGANRVTLTRRMKALNIAG